MDNDASLGIAHSETAALYANLSRIYGVVIGPTARATWQNGIIQELTNLGVASGKVFDLGAGSGIGAELLKSIGEFHVTSIDNSLPMLSQAMVSNERLLCDLRHPPQLVSKANVITLGCDTINYFNITETQALLRWIHEHLENDGILLFDYICEIAGKSIANGGSYRFQVKKETIRITHAYDAHSRLLRTEIQSQCADKNQWIEIHQQYVYGIDEIVSLLEEAKFIVLQHREIICSNLTPNYRPYCVVAKKQ